MRTIKLSFLLTVFLSMVGAQTFAHDIEVENDDGVTICYNFIKNNTELEVTYRGSRYTENSNEYSGNVVIPESVTYVGKTYSVTSIGEYAFYGCSALTELVIPYSVESIGNNVFYGCSQLEHITIEDGETTLYLGYNYNATPYMALFFGCPIKTLYVGRDLYAYYDNPYRSPFYACTTLTDVIISNTVTSIGNYMFYGCSGLTSLTIPNSVTSIGDYTFYGCSNVKQIILGEVLERIGSKAFAECRKLENVYSYAVRYPTASDDAFNNSYVDYVTLHVPAQSVVQYKNHTPWSDFMDIVPLTDNDPQPTGIDATLMNSGERIVKEAYDLGGKQLSQPQRGLNIVKMSDGTTKKVVVTK